MRYGHRHGHGGRDFSQEELAGWFAGRIPEGWFTGAPEVSADRDEILIVGAVADVAPAEGSSEAATAAARRGRITQFREDTREARIQIAREAEQRSGRRVSWGAECGGERELFTTAGVPIMTRLRMPERKVLDTLVEAGVARSRSHALAWCVRLVGENESQWIDRLRESLQSVQQARAEGPGAGPQTA